MSVCIVAVFIANTVGCRTQDVAENVKRMNVMIKCKLKCDRQYGGNYPWVDCDFMDYSILKEMVEKFTVDGILCVTEEVVDYYNARRNEKEKRRITYKTSNSIITHLRKYIKNNNL